MTNPRATVPVMVAAGAEPGSPYVDDAHARMAADHALAYLIGRQVEACERKAEPVAFSAESRDDAAAFAREVVNLLLRGWTDLVYRYRLPLQDERNVLRAALIVPDWVYASQYVPDTAMRHGIVTITTRSSVDWLNAGPDTCEHVLAVHTRDHMPPSLASQNYDVDAVYSFRLPPVPA